MNKRMYRLPKEGKILGVCAGLADYFGVDVTLMRIIFVILIFFTNGIFVLAYFLFAIAMPACYDTKFCEANTQGYKEKAEDLKKDLKKSVDENKFRNIFGIALILIGLWILCSQLLPGWFNFNWEIIWPCLLIAVGIFILYKRDK